MLEALIAANMQTQGVTIANDFQPIQIENPQTTTPTGSLYGKVEGGALVSTAPGVTTGQLKCYKFIWNCLIFFRSYSDLYTISYNSSSHCQQYWSNSFLLEYCWKHIPSKDDNELQGSIYRRCYCNKSIIYLNCSENCNIHFIHNVCSLII